VSGWSKRKKTAFGPPIGDCLFKLIIVAFGLVSVKLGKLRQCSVQLSRIPAVTEDSISTQGPSPATVKGSGHKCRIRVPHTKPKPTRCRTVGEHSFFGVGIADNLNKAGWSWCVSAVDSQGAQSCALVPVVLAL
jgi:hypothetical protein